MSERAGRFRAFWTTPSVAMAGLLLLYFGFPIGQANGAEGQALGWVLTLVGVLAVGYTFYRHIINYATGADHGLTIKDLLVLFEALLIVFSAVYFFMAKDASHEMNGINTRIDAFYFSLTTFATVGFGDITATGQIGRVIVSIQMLFDLVFVGALVSIASSNVKQRAAAGELPIQTKRKER